MLRSRNKYRKKWWVKPIRFMNYLAFRYWWFVWSFFIISLLLLYFFCCYNSKNASSTNINCSAKDTYFNNMREIDSLMLNCCECTLDTISNKKEPEQVIDSLEIDQVIDSPEIDSIPQAPKKNCRVHFAGSLISDYYVEGHISKIYEADNYSEYVGSGYYPNCKKAFPKADFHSFDGIAVDKGTRLIIYSKQNFQGQILVDIVGPAIMNNDLFRNDATLGDFVHKRFIEPLESNYPQSCRKWSESNMRSWSNGSCKIICSE